MSHRIFSCLVLVFPVFAVGQEHAVSPDGSRLLLLRGSSDETTTTLNVVTNWFTVMNRLTAANSDGR